MEKKAHYDKLKKRLKSQLAHENDWLANLSNTAQLFGKLLPEITWVGFYLHRDGQMILGPFWGTPAVTRIPMGTSVSGTAAVRRETLIVPDVSVFPGHIIGDIISRSEIGVPFFVRDHLLGVLDIDSPQLSRFDEVDRQGLEALLEVLVAATDFEPLVAMSR